MRALSAENRGRLRTQAASVRSVCHDGHMQSGRDDSSASFDATTHNADNLPDNTLTETTGTMPELPVWGDGDAGNQSSPAVQTGRTNSRGRSLLRNLWWIVPCLVLVVTVMLVFIPVPYVVLSPGPTINILGSHEGAPTIHISGDDPRTGEPVTLDPVHDDSEDAEGGKDQPGQLRMVTVMQRGGPGGRLNSIDLIRSWLSGHDEILPYDQVFPPNVTSEEVDAASHAQLESSQSAASVVALEHLGWDVPADVQIEGAVPGSDAVGKVEQGDQLQSITTPDGTVHPVNSGSIPFALMQTVPPDSNMTLTVVRDGKTLDIPIVSSKKAQVDPDSEEATSSSLLGVFLSVHPQLPLDIHISLQDVGGPSAGMMFALGIVDRMTLGDLTGGVVIAGTGALSFDGHVEPIGGIQQKMVGARHDGAQWFLAPSSNCDEVVGHIPDGLNVTRVDTFEGAMAAVQAIAAGAGDTLPTCEAR